METTLKNRKSPRLKNWDYSTPGFYFITMVTKNRENLFGEIKNGEMILNDFGKIVKEEFLKSFKIRKELFCDEYIIMPNHIHAILFIEDNTIVNGEFCMNRIPHDTQQPRRDTRSCVPTGKSISSFVAGFKSIVTKRINELRNTPKLPFWQSRFHDRIVRNEIELYNIRNYIKNNPMNWTGDDLSNAA